MKDLQTIVRHVLYSNPKTRDSDERLYKEILRLKGFEINSETFINYKNYDLPSFASVARARRRVQEDERNTKEPKDWKIQSSRTMNKHRRELEEKYREFYRN